MVKLYDRSQILALQQSGAQLVEVLEGKEYKRAHLPGAVHIPQWEISTRARYELDPERPVIVYCYDSQ